VAFATYPLTLLLSLFMAPIARLRLDFGYLAALPALVLGITILVVSLLRARKRVEDELALRQQAEAALRDLNTSLEQRVQARTAELQVIVDGLEAFTRNVSHDLRGPLAGLSGLARFSAKALDEGDPARAKVLVNAMAEEASRLQAMVGDLLTLSKVGDGDLHLHPQPLRRVVDAAVRQLERTPEGAESLHRVALEIDELPTTLADPELLGQVFVNLIGNAARFSAAQHRGGDHGTVRVGAEARGDETAIYVADDGPGFEPARAEDLFKPFRRLHDAQLSHNGIGLSIVKRIVERHGGRVWAETRPGAGATFWFTLGKNAASGSTAARDFSPSP
jgi:signal transduction histidine kinase